MTGDRCPFCGFSLSAREIARGSTLDVIGDEKSHRHVIVPDSRQSARMFRGKVKIA